MVSFLLYNINMKKVIFLDIDGVLNSTRTLYEDDSLEDDLILNLKELVNKTKAKIILSSSWRISTYAIATLMDKLDKFGLAIYGMTCDGVNLDWLEKYEFDVTKKYLDTKFDYDESKQLKITHDRGAEIFKWLHDHDDCAYVILDDEIEDIKPYFSESVIVKTSYKTGLTKEDIKKAIQILNKN